MGFLRTDDALTRKSDARYHVAGVAGQRCAARAASRKDGKHRDLPRILLVAGRRVTPNDVRMLELSGCDIGIVVARKQG